MPRCLGSESPSRLSTGLYVIVVFFGFSQFWFSQFVKCNFFNLVVATPDAMVDTSLRSLMACHNTKSY